MLAAETCKDHNYHVTQDTQSRHSGVGKRPNDMGSDFAESSLTLAKILVSENDEMKEGFTEGFILLEHCRHRTTEVPVLLTPISETQRLQQQTPSRLSAEVNTVAGGPIIRHRFTARNGLLLEVAEVVPVNELLEVRTLGNIPLQVIIPSAYLQNFGMIKGVPLWHTDPELAEFLQPEGNIAARRLYRRRGKLGDAAKASAPMILTFRPNTEPPSNVNLRFIRHELTKHIEARPSCFNGQALDHIAKFCKESTKSKKCGEPRSTKDCKGEALVKCAN